MKKNFYSNFTVILFVLSFYLPVIGQSVNPEKTVRPVGFDKSEKLSSMRPIEPIYRDRSYRDKVIPNKDNFLEQFQKKSESNRPDPVLQDKSGFNRSVATIDKNFAGVPNLNGYAPPDTDGDIGPNHYMQMVNSSMQIFDRNGNSLLGPYDNSFLWSGFTGPWTGTNDGDPIVIYDEYADRWIASQFALPNYPSGPFYELIAVSQTGDPTGSWYRYAYEFTNMPDYPKFGVWPDGYYLTINQFAPPSLNFAGAGVCVFDRSAMISGDLNAQMLSFNLGTSYGSLLPADADGPTQPVSGSPNYLVTAYSSTSLRLFQAQIDWNNTSNSTVSLSQTLTIPTFSYSGITINQPGTSQTLDALTPRLMYRLQYRNFGSYQVMLTNHTVNANSGKAGVRWYELRNYGSGWSLYQNGTFAPADGDNRWMGSIAMNGNGDIAIGYSVSGSSTYPSIRFAGQTAANSGTGVLDVSEGTIFAGSYSQTGVNRWGDYSCMSVDPVNDQTFWYTTEYSNGGWNWKTRIASFNFEPPVVLPPVADFSGTPASLMEGQTVSFTDQSTNNPTSWLWSFPGGTPSISTSANPIVTYNTVGTYDVSLTVSNSEGSDSETKTAYIEVTPYVVTYCSSSGTSASEWIDQVDLGSFTNSSGNNGGYGDFTSSIISVESGQTYNISLVPGFSSRSQRESWRVWIDYNNDGDFLDSGEEVFSANNVKVTVNGTVVIPSGLDVTTRMRVSMKRNSGATSCEVFSNGEVEDYTIQIGEPVPQAPVADFSGNPTAIEVGNSVQFADLSLNNPTSWSWSFAGGTPATSTSQNPTVIYDVEGIYDVTLTVSNNEGSDSKTINAYITVTQGGGTGSYCESSASSNALEWISGVQLGGFANNSGATLYSDFTSMIVGLAPGTNVNYTLTPGYSGSSEREFWRVWIDFNADGDFDDSDETLVVANNKKNAYSSSFSVPSYASGQTRMRVSMKNGSAPASCEVFGGGEVEDYTVDFGNGSSRSVVAGDLKLNIYPNPATNVLNINVETRNENVNVKVYDALGKIINDFNISNLNYQLDLSNLKNGIYFIGIDDGEDTRLKRFIKE